MNQSSAGDELGISVDRKPKTETNISINGYFNVLHTCGKTGEVKDYSGSNSISVDGLNRMFNGIAGSSGTSANTAGPYLLFSAGSPTIAKAGTHALQDALAVFGTPTTGAAVGTGTTEMFTLSGTDSVFGNNTVTISTFVGTLISEQLVLDCDATGTIRSIQICDRNTGTPASSTVLASRSVSGTVEADDQMTAITVNNGDTLTVTYTLSITAT